LLKLHALFIAEPMTAPALSPEQLMDGGALRMWQMLSPKTQTNLKNAKSYFAEHLAIGDYYGDAERIVGEWIGRGAEMLGLAGAVAKNDFVRLCENAHPQTRERLTQRLKYTRKVFGPGEEEREEVNRRVFFDFTFSPPKSVSIAALVVGDARIFVAHREAVKMAVAELEQFAATRIREAGCNSDRHTGNIVAALFEHETSRALDPHLHTHCIVFNATRDVTENRWKALQNHQMLVAQKYVENVYYHELSRALGSIGYTVENLARGDFRVTEISPTLCEQFSKRHREIDEQMSQFLADHPDKIDGNVHDVREHLAHKLRSRKLRDLPADRLPALWKSQLTRGDRVALRLPLAPAPQATMTSTQAVSCAEEHLFDRHSIVHEHELWRYALEFARGSTLTLADLKRETSARDYTRERGGRLTRKDVLSREWQIVQIAKNGVGHCAPFAASYTGDPAHLAEDQTRACKQLLASRDFVTLFRGRAGTGKSYVLREVQRAFDWAGAETVALAPQRQQVIDLEKDSLRHTQTVAEALLTTRIAARSSSRTRFCQSGLSEYRPQISSNSNQPRKRHRMSLKQATKDPNCTRTENGAACWRRERDCVCLRVEPKPGESFLFPYQHFTVAHHACSDDGEKLEVSFSTHDLVLHGRNLSDIARALQEFGIEWIAVAPERYESLRESDSVLITRIEIKTIE
jgi:conjugative relaxase-like TrwC/TraI family protein